MHARELFVWYRVRSERSDQARASVRAIQRSLIAAWPGLHARLLTRDDANGTQTWMETYSRSGAAGARGVDDSLTRAIDAAARPLATLIDGERHSEAFDCDEAP